MARMPVAQTRADPMPSGALDTGHRPGNGRAWDSGLWWQSKVVTVGR